VTPELDHQSMRRKRALGACRLCGELRDLQDSHILPQWTYRRAAQGSDGRQSALVFVDAKRRTSVLTNKQLKEQLLCFDCEQRFCRLERYVSQIAVQDDGSFPWLETVHEIPSFRRIKDSSTVDVETIARFACSVVWRGSVSSTLKPSLGEHEQPMAEYLLDSGALPTEVCVVVHLLTDPRLQRTLIPPQGQNSDGFDTHWFVVCGAEFQVFVGPRIPAELRAGCLVRKGVVIISEGADVMSLLVPSLAAGVPKGKLAGVDARR
jgi:hypothetical protein